MSRRRHATRGGSTAHWRTTLDRASELAEAGGRRAPCSWAPACVGCAVTAIGFADGLSAADPLRALALDGFAKWTGAMRSLAEMHDLIHGLREEQQQGHRAAACRRNLARRQCRRLQRSQLCRAGTACAAGAEPHTVTVTVLLAQHDKL